MAERDIIHNYLKSLSKYLSRLDKADADDVIREIESHIYDVLEASESEGRSFDAAAVLAGFGEPRELAAQYVDHMLDGTPPPEGFKAIQRVKRGATKGLYYAMEIFGYGLSLILMIVGVYKAFSPDDVGVWASASGESIIVGVSSQPPGHTDELLGWWLVPIAFGLAFGGAYLTKRILGVLKERL